MRSRLPKLLHPLCGLPMTSHVIRACRAAGVARIIVVVGHEAEQVRLKLIRSNRLCRTDICCNPEQAFVAYSVLCFGPSFEHPYFCDHLLRRIHSQTGHFRQSDHGVLSR